MKSVREPAAIAIGWALPCLSRARTPYAAHFPAAALCAAFAMCEYGEQIPTVAVQKAVRTLRREVDREIAMSGHQATCPHVHDASDVRDVFSPYFGRLSRSGHLQIIGTIAMKAARMSPLLITCQVLAGLHELAQTCLTERIDGPRYLGFPAQYEAIPERAGIPSVRDGLTAARMAINDLTHIPVDGQVEGVTYFFTGERLHALTFAHALIELGILGHLELVETGLDTFSLQMYLNRMRPPREDWHFHTPEVPSLTARTTWKTTRETPFDLAHRIKRSYAQHRIQRALGQVRAAAA
jgi:hypothetical protein